VIIDCHTHFNDLRHYEHMLTDQKNQGAEQFVILVIEKLGGGRDSFKLPHALWFKHRHPEKVYVFGSIDCHGMHTPGAKPEVSFVDQLKLQMEAGCDGLKLLTGKPDRRKSLNQPLCSEVFEPMFDFLEKTQYPVLWHVGDPPEFWFPDRVPLWAKQNRWWYDETYPPKRVIDAEIREVFRKHPRLNLILPHIFFLSDDIDEMRAFLEQYPNFYLDLAPGIEMLHNFTRQHTRSRELFINYAHRILFGTDIGIGAHETGPKRGWMIRNFLETDESFPVPDDPFMTPDERPNLKGIKLPKEALDKIYALNFQKLIGGTNPKPLNYPAVRKLLLDVEERSLRRGEGTTTAARVLDQLHLR